MDLSAGLVAALIIGIAAFYILHSIVKSIIKGIVYSALIAIFIFLMGMIVFLGFDRTFTTLKGVLNL
ncbi:hypothetical protein HY419_00420 [candidate division WWE3 bacterium]|nr:hypothetical protein [candidate division WWE3 bacterium]